MGEEVKGDNEDVDKEDVDKEDKGDKADVTPNAENESKIIFGFSLTCYLMLNIGTQNIIQI